MAREGYEGLILLGIQGRIRDPYRRTRSLCWETADHGITGSFEVCIRLAFLVEVSKMLSIGLRYLNGAVGLLGIYTGLAVQDQMFYQLIAIC